MFKYSSVLVLLLIITLLFGVSNSRGQTFPCNTLGLTIALNNNPLILQSGGTRIDACSQSNYTFTLHSIQSGNLPFIGSVRIWDGEIGIGTPSPIFTDTIYNIGDLIYHAPSGSVNPGIWGVEFISIYDANGCSANLTDSSYRFTFMVFENEIQTVYDTICSNGSYSLNGQLITETGQYIDTLVGFNSCDSIVQLNLSVVPNPQITLQPTDTIEVLYGSHASISFVGYGIRNIQWQVYNNGNWNNVINNTTFTGVNSTQLTYYAPNISMSLTLRALVTGYDGCGDIFTSATVIQVIEPTRIPSITTLPISNITFNSAVSGGDIFSSGGLPVTSRGVAYGTIPGPSTSNLTTQNGIGAGTFTAILSNLQSSTPYFARAYATNSMGTAYGNQISFTTSNSPIPNVSSFGVVGFITAPSNVKGLLQIGLPTAGWGFNINSISAVGRLVFGFGNSGNQDTLACDTLLSNASDIQGNIAVLYRGGCEIGVKALAAQRAGAIGVIIINENSGVVNINGGGCGHNVNIPVVMISNSDGIRLRNSIMFDSTVAIIGRKRNSLDNDLGFTSSNIIRPSAWSIPYTFCSYPQQYQTSLGAVVHNYGKLAQNDIVVNLRIDFTSEQGQFYTIYNQNRTINILARDSSIKVLFDYFDPSPYGRGLYNLNFSVQSNQNDYFDIDNFNTQQFLVSNDTYSKVRLSPNGIPLSQGNFRPTGGTGQFEYGIFLDSKTSGETYLDAIKFSLTASNGSNLSNVNIIGRVYKWIDNNSNNLLDTSELNLLGLGIYFFANNSISSGLYEIPITSLFNSGTALVLDSGTFFISIEYSGNQMGISMPIGSFIDYSATTTNSQNLVSAYRTNGNWSSNHPNNSTIPIIIAKTSPVNLCTFFADYIADDTLTECSEFLQLVVNTILPKRWYNGQTNSVVTVTESGWYWVDIDSGGCRGRDSVFVDLLKFKLSTEDTTICAGSALSLQAIQSNGQALNEPHLVDQFVIDFSRPFSRTLFTQIGQKYLITISGIFALKCDFENQLDAAYQFNHPQRPQKSHPFVQWNNEPIRPTPNTFNSSHNYVYSDLYATQSFQNFIFSDSNYSDNCGQLTFSIFQYNPLLTFLWSNGDTTSGIVVTPETSSQYSCIVSNGITTCSASATIQTIPTQVSSFAIVSYGSTNFCTGDSIELLANFTQASYLQWQKDYANIQGENSQTLTVKSSGVYRLAAYDDTLDCPRYSNTIPIVVQPKLNAIIDTPLRNFLCFGDSILIRAINDDGARIQWRKNGVVIPGSNDSILKVFQGGSYDFIVSKQGFCGDTSRDVSIYFDYSNIVPVIYASSNEVCAGSPVILQANGGSRYIWENGDTSRSIILFPNYSETYSVQVFSPGGCMAEDSIFINVHQFSSIAEIQTDSSHSLCTGDSIRLIVNRLSGSGDFIWSNGSTSDTIYATAGGLYELRILEQGSICDGAIIDSIRIEELRDSIMYAGLSTICRGDSITLIATNFRNGAWSNGDNSSSITISPDTNAIISVAYYSVNNCPVFDTLEIIVIPPVQPDTPRNLLPANHSYDLVSPIQFTWYPVSFASIYDLYIWDSNSQRPLQPTISNTGINITFEDLLNPSTEYLWQLAARNSCYTTFSDTMRFTYRAFPDLIIDSLEVPLSQFSGSQFNVTYSVKNIGGASTGPIQWFDRIYLSTDLDLDKNEDVFLAAYNNLMYLDTNQSYTRSVSVQLPTQLLSSVYLFVVADNEDAYLCNLPNRNCPSTAERHTHNIHMPELREDNNHDYKLLNIVPSPLPDLKVQSIGTPIAVFSGDTIPIVCLIENLGESEVISGSQWRNCYFISPDNLFNPSNSTALEALPYVSQFMSGPLSVNTSLSRSHQIILPDSLFGNYYIYAQTDCDNNIFEGIGENNNLGRTESVINITLTPPPDLAVTTIIVPNQLTTPGSLPISYSVQNQGATSPRICLWTDSIWLSRDSILQPNTDIPLGALVYFGGNSQFLPGQSYHRSGNFFVPQGIEGSFYVIVCSDAKKEVFEHTYESNNIGHSNAISCTVAPFADLQIQNAIIPALDTLIADSIYTLQWEVKNHGQFYAAGGFYDQIVTIPSGNPNDTTIVLTGPIVHNDTIFPGDSKIMSATFTTPNISGFHDILIKTDVGNSVFEHTLENNNSFGGTADSTTKYFKSRPGSQGNPNLLTYYDFEVVSLISPAYGISGQNVQISYRVKNNGPLPNPGFWWNEEIHLSSDSNFSQYTVLGTSINAGVIRVGNFYNRTLTTQIPNGTFGPHFIRVFIDPTNRLIGDLVRSNNQKFNPIPITLNQLADLIPQSIAIPQQQIFTGQQIQIPYSISNVGLGSTGLTLITDAIYINNLPNLNQATLIGSLSRQRNLNPNTLYFDSISVNIPIWAYGNYYIILQTDATNSVFENIQENNNLLISSSFINPTSNSGVDLSVAEVITPDTMLLGKDYQINYSLTNTGTSNSVGPIRDGFFFGNSPNYIGQNESLFSYRDYNHQISPRDTLSYSLYGRMPGIGTGSYFGHMNTNINLLAPEINLNNNSKSAGAIFIDAQSITLNHPDSFLLDLDEPAYYKIETTDNKDLIIRIQSNHSSSGVNQIFVAYNRIPSTSNFDFISINGYSLNQTALIPNCQIGTYYILVNTQSRFNTKQNIRIQADTLGYQIISCEPNRLGQNVVTTRINGAGFMPGIQFYLTNSNQLNIAQAETIQLISSMQADVTWDLSSVNLGNYILKCVNPNQSIATLNSTPIIVEASSGYAMSGNSVHNDVIRFGRNATFSFTFKNTGNIDIPIARNEIAFPDNVQIMSMNYSGRNSYGLSSLNPVTNSQSEDYFSSGGFHIIPVVCKGMRPGEQLTINVTARDFNQALFPFTQRMQGYSTQNFIKIQLGMAELYRNSIMQNISNFPYSVIQYASNPILYRDTLAKHLISTGLLSPIDTVGLLNPCLFCPSGITIDPGIAVGQVHFNSLNLNSGSVIKWDINLPDRQVGNELGWDVIQVHGQTSISITNEPVKIKIFSKSSFDNSESFLSGFEPWKNQKWPMLISYSGITGFNINHFEIDPTHFNRFNNTFGGSFTLQMSLNFDTLFVVFNPTSPLPGMPGYDGNAGHIGQPGGKGGPGGPGTCLLSPGIGGNGGNGGAGEFGMAPGNGGNGGYGGVSTCTNFPGGTGGRGGNGGNGSVNQNGGNGGNGGIGGPGYYLSSGSRGGVGGNGGSGGAGGSCSNMNLAGTGGSGGSGGRGGQGYGINGNGGNGGNGGNSGNGGNGSGSPGSPGLPGEGGSANNPLLIAGSLGAAGSIGDFGLPVSPNNPCAPDPIGAINVPPVPCNTPQTVNRVLCSQFAESIADNLDCNNSISSAIDNAIRTIGQGIQQSVSTAVGNALFSGIQFGIGLLDCNSSGIEYVSSISCSPNLVDLRNQTTFYPIVSPYCTRYMLCKDIPIITACDPNDIAGPPGYGPERFISRDDTILYTINFENDSNFATTAAQTVRITQFLDSHLSPLSVRIKEFGFGSHTFQVPGQRANFSMTLPLQDQPEIGVDVQVTGGVDVNSYEFFMVFQSVNRYTGLPPSDPRAGFLKVNDSTGRGEGFVTFSVNPISTCVTGDSIFAQADILFDVNSLIMTNQIFNTIDAGKPVSTMGNLNAIQDSTFFELRWSAADDTRGSGVSYLNLFASRNSEPYSLYASILPTDSVFGFTGLPNSRYSLFTQSVDNVNNKENIKNFAENIIFIQSGEIAVLYPQGNSSHCAGDSILISWVSNAEIDSFKIEISSDSGQTFQTIANIVDSIQNSYSWQIPNNLSQGMYLFRVSNPDGRISANSEYVQINRLPAIGLPSTVRVCPGTQTVLHANDGISYSWSPGESLSDSTISEPTVYPDISKWYKVTVTNQNGCSKTDSVFVQVGRFDTTLQTQFACGSSQLYYDTTWLINTIGCDSMVITTYLPRPTFHDTVYFSGICQGDTILAGNFTIISEGWYTDTLKSQFNCDSTIIYRVVYITNNSQQRFISLCNGDSILINNHWIKNSGIYIESFPASNLCDSIIYYSIDVINCSRLHGNLLYDNSIQSPLINTRINLYKNNVLSGTTLTDSLGRYSFERFPVGTYRLEMEDRLDWGGVTATDALLVQRQSTGSLNLSFLRYLAGDVNLNSVVNSADALIISRRWTGLINTFLSGNYAFIAPNIDITYQDSEVNLKTICFGDVNGSYNPNITQLRISPSKIMESDFNPSSNSKTLPIYLNRNLPVGAMSINLFLPEGLQVTDVTLDDESPTLLFKQNGAMLKLSWFNVHGLFSSPDKPLINLHFDNQPEWTNLINKHGIYIDTQGSELADLEGNIYSQWGFSIPNHSPENRIDNVLIYPNPTKSMVYIKGNFDSVAVKDNLGRSLDVTVIYSNPTSIDFSKYSNGVYFISLNKNGKTILRKIVLYRD